MSNGESDRIERILDLAASGRTAEALSMLQEAEAGQTEAEAMELESCRRLLHGIHAVHEGRRDQGRREALPALAYLEHRFRQMENQYQRRLAAVARNVDVFAQFDQASRAEPNGIHHRSGQPPQGGENEDVRDALTGSLNRRGLTLASEAHFGPGQRLALVLADVDHFKSIHDRFGPDAGDKVLQVVAQIFTKSLRDSDLVARLEDDAFLLLVNSVEKDAAWGTCERLRLAVERYGWGTIAADLRVTVSIGLAVRLADEELDPLLTQALIAAAQAKAVGRNRVIAGR